MKKLLWIVGFLVGVVFCVYWHMNNSGRIGRAGVEANLALQNLTIALWPSSLMLLALTGQHLGSTIVIESISVITNGFIYMGVGSVFIRLYRLLAGQNR